MTSKLRQNLRVPTRYLFPGVSRRFTASRKVGTEVGPARARPPRRFPDRAATGTAERKVALAILEDHVTVQRSTVAADKGHDQRPFVEPCRPWASHRTARSAEGPVYGDRRANHPTPWLHGQPAHSQTCRRDLRLGEDGRWLPSHAIPRNRENLAGCVLCGAAYNLLRWQTWPWGSGRAWMALDGAAAAEGSGGRFQCRKREASSSGSLPFSTSC